MVFFNQAPDLSVMNLSVMNTLIQKQKDLMAAVQHPVREDSHARMLVIRDLFEDTLLFLAATGHKPWRPNPLPLAEQDKRLSLAIDDLQDLVGVHKRHPEPSAEKVDTLTSRILTSTFGAIEEAIEFYDTQEKLDLLRGQSPSASPNDAAAIKKEEDHQVEELTDELFFFLERMIMTNITWEMVVKKYHEKHAINMKRYADAKKNDFSWDERAKGQL